VSLWVQSARGSDNSVDERVCRVRPISLHQSEDSCLESANGLLACAPSQRNGARSLLQVATRRAQPLPGTKVAELSLSHRVEGASNATHKPTHSQPQSHVGGGPSIPVAAGALYDLPFSEPHLANKEHDHISAGVTLSLHQVPEASNVQPLPKHLTIRAIRMILGTVAVLMMVCSLGCFATSFRREEQGLLTVGDPMSYNAESLLKWRICFDHVGTIWENSTLWCMVRRLSAVSLGTALLELVIVPDPSSLDPMRFSDLGRSLNMFVGLLVSFFLASSAGRWFSGINGFLTLFEAIRQLQLQLHSLGAPKEKVNLAMRYGVLSAWMIEKSIDDMEGNDEKEAVDLWTELEAKSGSTLYVLPEERALLEDSHDPACHFWMLVASLLGRMAQDGDIPCMSSPTYGRIVSLAQDAQDAMKAVREVGQVKMPYVYTHTLAVIVHLNNLLCALSFGLTLGACMGSVMAHTDGGLHFHSGEPHPHHLLVQDVQDVMVQFFQCFLSPVLCMAFLEIGVSLSTPLSGKQARIPAKRLFDELLEDLENGNKIAASPPLWKKPSFKVPQTD